MTPDPQISPSRTLPETEGFVIVCDARSGSSFLRASLDSHPDIVCHRELFNAELVASRFGVQPFVRSSHGDPIAYLQDMRVRTRDCTGVRLIGFKLHFRQCREVLSHVLGDRRQRIILLCRRDKLAQWGSYRLALTTRQWAHPKDDGDVHPTKLVPFTLRKFMIFLVHQRAWERYVRRRRPDCLCVYYEDIVRPDGLVPILSYLGVDPHFGIKAGTRQQFTGKSTYERFSNPRFAAFGSRLGYAAAWLIHLLGATPLVRRFTHY